MPQGSPGTLHFACSAPALQPFRPPEETHPYLCPMVGWPLLGSPEDPISNAQMTLSSLRSDQSGQGKAEEMPLSHRHFCLKPENTQGPLDVTPGRQEALPRLYRTRPFSG